MFNSTVSADALPSGGVRAGGCLEEGGWPGGHCGAGGAPAPPQWPPAWTGGAGLLEKATLYGNFDLRWHHCTVSMIKLDGVGPVDNRPSTN